jgi:hypothetical protein
MFFFNWIIYLVFSPIDYPELEYKLRSSLTYLLLSSIVQGVLFQQSVPVVDLDNVTIGGQLSSTTHGNVLFSWILGESPLQRLEDLLASGKLEFTATNGFNHMGLVVVLGPDAHQDLPDFDTSRHTNGLSVRVTHSAGESIGSSTRQHLVGAEDVEGMGAYANVEGIFSNVLSQVLVDGDAASFQRFTRDLLLLVAHKMGDKGKLIDGRPFGTHVKNLDLGFGHTTAVPRLDVRLVLLVAVATRGTTTHLYSSSSLLQVILSS